MKIFYMFMFFLFAVGCTDNIEKMKLTKEERDRVLSLQNPFGSNLVRLNGSEGVLIGLRDCKVYRAKSEQGVVLEWIRLSEIDEFYPLPSGCSRQHLKYDGDYVTIDFCKTPIGAGGGCAGGISPHRSRNGKDWEVYVEKDKWQPITKQ